MAVLTTTPISDPCPSCKKPELVLHPGKRVCGCTNCLSIFRYPSMELKA